MITTWRDRPSCPPEWDEQAEWNEHHTCGDCRYYAPCPCVVCKQGWCMLEEGYVHSRHRCCGDGMPREGLR